MTKPKKRIFRARMNFDKAELAGRISLGASGISMPYIVDEELEEYRKKFSRQKDSMNFGMFGNDPKYYADVKDITPKPEDFVEVPFRLISATTVGGGSWKATDFSNARVLKKSVPLLDGVPLYKDHETDLDNWVGLVNGVKWTKSFTNSDGTPVPAGIDGIVAIDKVTNPKVARGVLAGAIFSNSVTVEFDWEMSHQFENEWDFLNKIGTIGSDGKMIRRVVTDIHNYHESSLVWLGADPFAKAIDTEGNLKNIDISSVYNFAKQSFGKSMKIDFSKEEEMPKENEPTSNLVINFAVDKNVLSLAQRKQKPEPKKSKNNTDDMKEFIKAFILTFGKELGLKDGDQPTEAQMIEYTKQLSFVNPDEAKKTKKALKRFNALQEKALEVYKKEDDSNKDATEVDMVAFIADHTFIKEDSLVSLQEDAAKVEKLEKKVTKHKANAKLGKEYINLKRTEAIRLYKTAVGSEKVDDAVIALFKDADSAAIDGLLKQYTKEATHKFSGSCSDCGSKNFQFKSSLSQEDETLGMDAVTEESVSAESIYKKKNQSSMTIGRQREAASTEE